MNRENDMWEPLGLDPARDYHTEGRWMRASGGLKPGVTRAQAQAHMAALAKRLEAAYPKFDAKWSVERGTAARRPGARGEDVAVGADGRGGAAAGGGVRQRGEPAAGAATERGGGDGHAAVAGGGAEPRGPATADRERDAGAGGRTAGSAGGKVGSSGADGARARAT